MEGAAAKPSPPLGTLPKGARPGPGLHDNVIDSGSSAAQLPQKSILERKEVLVGEARLQAWGKAGCGVSVRQEGKAGALPLNLSSHSTLHSMFFSLQNFLYVL